MDKMNACLSSSSKSLFMFKNASQKCTEIINFICKDNKCKENDINKGPQIKFIFKTKEFNFFSDDYLYTQGKGDDLKIKCRFAEYDSNEACPEDSLIIGKAFYNKYVPVIRYKKNQTNNKLENGFEVSIAWLPYFDNYKHKTGLKWAMIGISISILVLIVFIALIQKIKKSKPEDYHQVQN